VILVPGPPHEVKVVRNIYQMLISEGLPIYAIASELNRRHVPYQGGSRWTHHTVADVLTQPKYAGFHVYGRTTSRLYTPTVRLPKSDWLVSPGAFEPVLEYSTFLEAQRILQSRTINKSDEELLGVLRRLLAREGRLSLRLVKESPDLPSPSTYRLRFGSLRKAYELIGYGCPDQFGAIDLRRRTQALREELIDKIVELFPDEGSIVRRGARWRSRLRLRNRPTVSSSPFNQSMEGDRSLADRPREARVQVRNAARKARSGKPFLLGLPPLPEHRQIAKVSHKARRCLAT
jgi:hypothetical protein